MRQSVKKNIIIFLCTDLLVGFYSGIIILNAMRVKNVSSVYTYKIIHCIIIFFIYLFAVCRDSCKENRKIDRKFRLVITNLKYIWHNV